MSLQFDEQLISVAEAAKLLQVSQSTLWRWIDSGKLPAYRIGLRRIRLKRADLQQLVSPARPENSGATASTQPQTGRRLSELEKRRALAALDVIEQHAKEIVAKRGIERFSDSTEILYELRDERSKQLS